MKTADPTPEEIKQRCAEIRQGWTEYELWRRSSHRPKPYEIPVVKSGSADECARAD